MLGSMWVLSWPAQSGAVVGGFLVSRGASNPMPGFVGAVAGGVFLAGLVGFAIGSGGKVQGLRRARERTHELETTRNGKAKKKRDFITHINRA